MIAGLTFDEDSHTYRFEGVVVPSVTQILKPLSNFSMVNPDVLQSAGNFGTAVHLACELDDLRDLDEASLDPALLPYLQAWRKFSVENAVAWDLIEARVYHPTMRYAGTLDRYGKVNGKWAVVDIKTSASMYPSYGPQLSAYKGALPVANPTCARIGVQLKGDGSYVAKPYTSRTDSAVFASLLTLRNWCAENNVTPSF